MHAVTASTKAKCVKFNLIFGFFFHQNQLKVGNTKQLLSILTLHILFSLFGRKMKAKQGLAEPAAAHLAHTQDGVGQHLCKLNLGEIMLF